MKFKEQLQKDLAIFINPDEFADKHFVDGVEMDVVVDVNRNSDFKKVNEIQTEVYRRMTTIMYVGVEEELPRVGYQMNFDGFEYDVTSASFENGMHILNLVRNEG